MAGRARDATRAAEGDERRITMRKRSEVAGSANGGAAPAARGGVVCPECSHRFDEATAKVSENVEHAVSCPRCLADVAVELPLAKTVCAECGTRQRATASGLVCELGHGGVDGISPAEWEAKLQAAKDRAKPTPVQEAPASAPRSPVGAPSAPGGGAAAPPADSARHEAMRAAARGAPTEPPVAVAIGYGELVSATWGEELFTPKQFNSFRLGPFSGSTTVRPGEDRGEAFRRLYAELEAHAEEAFEKKKRDYLRRLQGILRASAEG